MQRYIMQRFGQGLLLLVLVAAIVFFLGRLTGNPVDLMLPEDATEADRQALIATLGLDRSYTEQFVVFLGNALRGDLGVSIRYRQPAVEIFFSRLPNTLKLVPGTLVVALALALPLGILSAIYRGSVVDKTAGILAVLGIATPNFWLGIILIYIFSVHLRWLPSARMGGAAHYVLPTITLGTFLVAGFMRLIRSSMLEVLDSEFVKLARLKGLPEVVVVVRHALRNALIPVLTLFGVFLASLVTGAIVTETVFAWPGVGRLTFEAVLYRDYPLLQAVVILDAVLVLMVTLAVDILYAYIDPRIRYT
jgi:peptide/nickel transport system permease protein